MEFLYLLIALALASIVVVFALKRKRGLSSATKMKIGKLWERIGSIEDPNSRVLEAEKVVDILFTELGYEGSFGEKLKKIGKALPNEQAVWDAHKLRNRIAHEAGIQVSSKEAKVATKAFAKVILHYTK